MASTFPYKVSLKENKLLSSLHFHMHDGTIKYIIQTLAKHWLNKRCDVVAKKDKKQNGTAYVRGIACQSCSFYHSCTLVYTTSRVWLKFVNFQLAVAKLGTDWRLSTSTEEPHDYTHWQLVITKTAFVCRANSFLQRMHVFCNYRM